MSSIKDQPIHVQKLYRDAMDAMARAKPYCSGVRVGASARVAGLQGPVQGFNIEVRGGYNDGIHAEHTLLGNALMRASVYGITGENLLEEILVTGNVPGPIAPCGSCLDWIAGYARDEHIPVHMTNDKGAYSMMTLRQLLPMHTELSNAGTSVDEDGFKHEVVAYHREAREVLAGQSVFGANQKRAAVLISAGKIVHGGTYNSDAYHGTQALYNAIVNAPAPIKGDRLVALIFDENLNLTLPFGIERQELFQFAAGNSPVTVYYHHDGRVFRTDSKALMPCGFYLAK